MSNGPAQAHEGFHSTSGLFKKVDRGLPRAFLTDHENRRATEAKHGFLFPRV
jgi:hypothetical protein